MSRRPPRASLRSGSRVGQVALAGVPLRDLLLQLRQPVAGVGAPVVGDGRPRAVDVLRVARDAGDVEQADRGRQVARGHGAALVDGADAVVQLYALVPDRVPEPVGQRGEVGGAEGAAVVQQDEVEVAERPASRRARLPTAASATPSSRRPAEACAQMSCSHSRPNWAGSPGGRAGTRGGRTPGCRRRSRRREVRSVMVMALAREVRRRVPRARPRPARPSGPGRRPRPGRSRSCRRRSGRSART